MIATRQVICSAGALLLVLVGCASARSVQKEESGDGVIPSPNQAFGEEAQQVAADESQHQSKVLADVPVYVSPYARTERSAPTFENQQESSQAQANYASQPAASGAVAKHMAHKDLKTAASHGHGHHGYDHSGWLDMGAWTGGKGSFGWYADYPVGAKHGHGRRR